MDKLERLTNWFKDEDQVEQWFRMKFHTYAVLGLTWINLVLGLLGFFTWLSLSFSIPFIPHLNNFNWPMYIGLTFLPLFTWFYSTITQPIKKGYTIVLDWRLTEKGRLLASLGNLIPHFLLLWGASARYIEQNYEPILRPIRLTGKSNYFLLVYNLDPFITLLYMAPLITTLIIIVTGFRHYKINEDILRRQFFTWEFPWLSRISHSFLHESFDVIVGWDKATKKPLVLKEDSRFLHELVNGATGSGKTSTAILIRIASDLVKIAKGLPGGIIVLEPKGDLVDDVVSLAKKIGVPEEKILIVDPTKDKGTKFNPFFGPLDAAAESFRGTLNALTGDQDPFFKGQQEETAALYTMLAKIKFGSLTNISHIQRMYQDPRYLADVTESTRKSLTEYIENKLVDEKVLEQWDRIVRYFEDEVLDYKTFREKDEIKPVMYPEGHRYAHRQVVESKKDKFVSGAKKYLNDIAMNSMMSSMMIANENEKVLNLDEFLENGGVLCVNTALGELDELSLLFGQFFIRQLQSAVFRRPKDGEEVGEEGHKRKYKRIPFFLNIDEFPLYANEAFERFLTLGRSYKVGTLIAIQSLGQLNRIVNGYRETILTNASTKTVFGRGSAEDNKLFSETFLEEIIVEESLNESTTPVTIEKQQWGYRHNTQKQLAPRFTPTKIAELPFKHMIIQMVKEDGSLGDATLATGKFTSEAKFLQKYFKSAEIELKTEQDDDQHELIEKGINKISIKSNNSNQPTLEELSQISQTEEIAVIDSIKANPVEEPAPETEAFGIFPESEDDDALDLDYLKDSIAFSKKGEGIEQGEILFEEKIHIKNPKTNTKRETVNQDENNDYLQLDIYDEMASAEDESMSPSIPDEETLNQIDQLLAAAKEVTEEENDLSENSHTKGNSLTNGVNMNLDEIEDDL
ncbi:type IV secretory system conjugative DNA transfer family protein [Bacillus infantis]|uniref:type IV secretory system conjugative DNA transfer family protein n=1 Tax=Bacillus infantis TaxID=324767 RepID=UPI00209DF6A0|nr:type IV secretory system conjugative DNA transfer family protein [Bacillus infantis]MCP1161421.1 type IV secretory system conjugative DNA transfer family protein [Bacillus infantis]